MAKSNPVLGLFFLTGIFLLGCALLPLPSTSVEPAPTFAMPTFSSLPTTPPEPTTGTGLENENLLVEVPAGFKIDYEAKQDNMIINEIVPQGESVTDWTTMVTVQIFLGMTESAPEQYQETLTQSWFNACLNSESNPIASGDENGYNFVVWQLYCPLNPSTQKAEETYFKAIQGNDSFYLVQVAFRHEPSSDEITQWVEYLKSVQVCDSRIPERVCP
jgi:hypothetical protein